MQQPLKLLLISLKALLLAIVIALGASAMMQLLLTKIGQRQAPPPGELYETSAGKLHLHCIGSKGPTLIIEAGGGAWSTFWTHIQKNISTDRRTCVYDRAGLGWSQSARQAQSAEEYAQNLHEVLSLAGEEPPYILAGHSLGGYLIRIYAEHYPHDIAGLIFIDSAHEDQWTRLPAEFDAFMQGLLSQMKFASYLANFGLMRVMPPPEQGLSPQQETIIRREMATARFWRANLAEFRQGMTVLPDAVRELSRMDNPPLLVISAEKSAYLYCSEAQPSSLPPCGPTQAIWDELQEDLTTLSSESRQVVIPDATHAIYVDAPEEIATVIGDFLKGLAAGNP